MCPANGAKSYRFRDNLPVMKTITIDTALMQMMAASWVGEWASNAPHDTTASTISSMVLVG